jgi:hypothetical protein
MQVKDPHGLNQEKMAQRLEQTANETIGNKVEYLVMAMEFPTDQSSLIIQMYG